MAEEIVKKSEVFNGKWINVDITFDALVQFNKVIIGDKLDPDDKDQVEIRKQVHKDCLKLMDEFHPD